jgi:hypothetical protein
LNPALSEDVTRIFLFSFSSYCGFGIKEGYKPIQTIAPQWENSIHVEVDEYC